MLLLFVEENGHWHLRYMFVLVSGNHLGGFVVVGFAVLAFDLVDFAFVVVAAVVVVGI